MDFWKIIFDTAREKTMKTVGTVGIEMLQDGGVIKLEPKDGEDILVVVDMQVDFVNGTLGTPEAQGIVANVCDAIDAFDGMLIVTKDTHDVDYMGTQEGRNLPVSHCVKGTDGWQLDGDVAHAVARYESRTGRDAIVFEKGTFGSKELAMALALADVRRPIAGTVRLIGLCTDICVISNALLVKAFLPEVEVVCDARCCAGVTPMAHEAALRTMESCQVKVIHAEVE